MRITFNTCATWVAIALTYILTSCVSVRDAQFKSQLAKSNCNQQIEFNYSKKELPRPIHEIAIDTILTNRFSFRSLNTANAHGLLDLLTKYVKNKIDYKGRPTLEQKVELIEIAQKINQRINLASLEISAVASEIDCEEERIDQVATYLKGKENETETRLTAAAIVIGAAGTIVTGILLARGDDNKLSDEIGIGMGLTEAALGYFILRNTKKIEFYHPRNALKDIWQSPETSKIFPPSVWYYLTYDYPATPEKSIRQELINKWLDFGQIANAKDKKKEQLYTLYFGEGGKYSSEQLKNRADMYDQIESQVKLMKQNLTVLTVEFEGVN